MRFNQICIDVIIIEIKSKKALRTDQLDSDLVIEPLTAISTKKRGNLTTAQLEIKLNTFLEFTNSSTYTREADKIYYMIG